MSKEKSKCLMVSSISCALLFYSLNVIHIYFPTFDNSKPISKTENIQTAGAPEKIYGSYINLCKNKKLDFHARQEMDRFLALQRTILHEIVAQNAKCGFVQLVKFPKYNY